MSSWPQGRATADVVLAFLVATVVLASGSAAAAGPAPDADRTPIVAVSIPPQAWFVERIGGPDVRILVLVAPGESPASFDPSPRLVQRLADAELYLRIGVPMENSLLEHLRRTLPALGIVDMRAGIAAPSELSPPPEAADADVPEEAAHPGDVHDHGHDGIDPHVWLSPRLARVLARNTCTALTSLAPDRADAFDARLASVDSELVALDADLTARLAPVRDGTLLVYHPAFGYFAAAYGLTQVAVEEGGLAPTPRRVAEILDLVRRRDIGTIFMQPQFSESSARSIARQAGLEIVVLDPLARDYAANLRRMADAVRAALER